MSKVCFVQTSRGGVFDVRRLPIFLSRSTSAVLKFFQLPGRRFPIPGESCNTGFVIPYVIYVLNVMSSFMNAIAPAVSLLRGVNLLCCCFLFSTERCINPFSRIHSIPYTTSAAIRCPVLRRRGKKESSNAKVCLKELVSRAQARTGAKLSRCLEYG